MNRKLILLIIVILLNWTNVELFYAQDIPLPQPQTTGGMSLMEALNHRRSIRYYKDQDISSELLSTLLWAANGINRPESGKRTAPAAYNIQNISIYVAKADGLYLYNAEENRLEFILQQDIRSSAGTLANVHFIYVADYSHEVDNIERLSAANTGFIGQNVYLCCAAQGLATVIQSSINKTALKNLMNLKDQQKIMLVQPIGYPLSPSQLNKSLDNIKQFLKQKIQSMTLKKSKSVNTSNDIILPEPQHEDGRPLLDALSDRKSIRNFQDQDISIQTLSDLLWSAFGINRTSSGKRTAPSAYNTQNIDIYIARKDGVYLFNAAENKLQFIIDDDIRTITGVNAPLNLIFVGNQSSQLDDFYFYSYAHTGFISQNVYLFCAANNLGTVVQSSIDREQLHSTLNLTSNQEVIFTQSLGVPKISVNEADSLGTVSLYQSTQGENWTDNTNWLQGPISDWFGVTELNGFVTHLDLHNNNLQGTLPTSIGDLEKLEYIDLSNNQLSDSIPNSINHCSALQIVNLSNNHFTDLPDISTLYNLDSLRVENNRLSFEDIESNINIPSFIYSPQDSIGARQDTLVSKNLNFFLTVKVDGSTNLYQWLKNGLSIPSATDDTLRLESITLSDTGSYSCQITNTIAPELILYQRPIHVQITPQTNIANDDNTPPIEFALEQNYPNPFNPMTTIAYQLSNQSHVNINVYNSSGEKVRTLINAELPSGKYQIQYNAQNGPSGIYFYRIQVENLIQNIQYTKIKKMVLLK